MKVSKVFLVFALLAVFVSLSVCASPKAHASSQASVVRTTVHNKNITIGPLIYSASCTSNVTVHLVGEGDERCYYGSGTAYPAFTISYFYAGNWSGYFLYNNYGSRQNFCDFQGFNFNATVNELFLSPTKEPYC